MAINYGEFSDLISQFYADVETPFQWRNVLLAIMHFLDGTDTILFTPTQPPEAGGLWLFESSSYPPVTDLGMSEQASDTLLAQAVQKDLSDLVETKQKDVVSAVITAKQGRLASTKIIHNEENKLISSLLLASNGTQDKLICFGLRRSPDHPAFKKRDIEQATMVLSHLDSALRLNQKFSDMHQSHQFSETCSDQLPWAQGIVNIEGKLIKGNKVMQRLLRERDRLYLVNNSLSCMHTGDTKLLLSTLQLLASNPGNSIEPRVIRLRRSSGIQEQLFLTVSLLPDGTHPSLFFQVKVLDLSPNNLAIPSYWLRDLYRLTSAECRLVELLMNGLSPIEAAKHLQVTANTVRSQIQAIYLKTGIHKQADLYRLVMGLGGLVQKPEPAVSGGSTCLVSR